MVKVQATFSIRITVPAGENKNISFDISAEDARCLALEIGELLKERNELIKACEFVPLYTATNSGA